METTGEAPGTAARVASALLGLARRDRPPGPWNPFPWVSVLRSYRRDPFGHLERMATYGDVVYARIGLHRTFLISHPDHVEDVLVRSRAKFAKDPMLRRLSGVLGQGLLTAEGDLWRRNRRLMAGAFTPRRVQRYAEAMVDGARQVAGSWAPGQVVDVGADMARLTLEVLVRAVFGVGAKEHAATVARSFETVSAFYAETLGRVEVPEWIPTPANVGLRRARAALHDVVSTIIRERRRAGVHEDDPDLLGQILAAQHDDHDHGQGGRGLSDDQLKDEVLTLLLAGHETTSLLLTYAWHLLGRHPEADARLAAELREVCPTSDPTLADVERLVFTRQVLLEALRLYPPASALGRQAVEDHALGGWVVPKGSLVFFAQWVMHRDPRFFDDPLAFRPERWTPAFERALPRFAFFPFGGGERVCIGESFAMLEARLVLATLARRVRFEPIDAAPLEVVPAITMRPKRPVHMRVAAR